jgi:subtilisin-like proprotein convertase family protein
VRDAQPTGATFAAPGNQQMVIIFSAGNAGAGSNTAGSPGTGKNVLTVGASEGVQPIGGADKSGVDDTGADNYNDIIGFSSRGPTDDGRQKPDLVAPGTHVTGGLWQAASPGANGTADPGFDGSGVSGGTGGSPFVPAGQQWYTASSGTSHSAPAVAGGAALVRQYFINQGLDPASPAMTKAFMMSTARYLTGLDGSDTLPSPYQGMGLLDLGHAFDTTPQILRDQVAADTFTASGQSRTIVGTISDPTKPLRVTLAWTDAPGPTTGSAFLNNLDLEVTINAQTYRGNVFAGPNSTTGGSPDPRNNVESVFLPAGIAAGTPFSIRVVATNVIADGVPNSGGALDQDYALVAANAVESPTAVPILQFGSMSFVSEGFLPANGIADPGETVSVALALSNVGSAPLTSVTVTLQSGDATILDASQGYGAIPAGGSVSRTFRLRVSPTAVCGGALTLTFDAQEGAEGLGTHVESLVPNGMTTGANATALSLPNGAPVTTAGAASLYPSNISIGPVLAQVASVSVTLTGLAHTFPSDLEVLLVGPGGQRVTLMSDVGGGTDIGGVILTFEDGAAALPTSTVLRNGTYAPANYAGGTDVMPAPAPAGPYGSTLSIFNGTNPNGTWSLYISDSESGDAGSLAEGWSLSIGLETPACAAAGVSGTPTSGLSTREIGGTATFDVVLNRAPSADVTIAVSSGDTGEGTVSPSSLTFTPANWYIPQSVTVTGVPDGVPDGDQPYTVALAPAVSSDLTYSGFDALDISITSLDSFRAALPLVVRVP